MNQKPKTHLERAQAREIVGLKAQLGAGPSLATAAPTEPDAGTEPLTKSIGRMNKPALIALLEAHGLPDATGTVAELKARAVQTVLGELKTRPDQTVLVEL